jgi:hypothetical protein
MISGRVAVKYEYVIIVGLNVTVRIQAEFPIIFLIDKKNDLLAKTIYKTAQARFNSSEMYFYSHIQSQN